MQILPILKASRNMLRRAAGGALLRRRMPAFKNGDKPFFIASAPRSSRPPPIKPMGFFFSAILIFDCNRPHCGQWAVGCGRVAIWDFRCAPWELGLRRSSVVIKQIPLCLRPPVSRVIGNWYNVPFENIYKLVGRAAHRTGRCNVAKVHEALDRLLEYRPGSDLSVRWLRRL